MRLIFETVIRMQPHRELNPVFSLSIQLNIRYNSLSYTMAAEALGIASSITALAGAAVAAFRVSESMYNIAQRVQLCEFASESMGG